jgi:multiple sugar transport system substrate-binding protein
MVATAAHLTVLCWDHPRCVLPMRAAAHEWQRLHPDVRVDVAARPLAAFNDQPVTEIATAADLMFIDHPMVGTLAGTDAVLPLQDLLPAATLSALASDSVAGSHDSYLWRGQQWATAVDAACQVSVVDEARLARIGGPAPRRWPDVLAVARRFPGAVAIPLYPSDAVLSLMSIAANLRAHGEGAGGLWSLEAVRVLCELVRWADPRSFDVNPPRLLDLMAKGPTDDVPVYAPLLFGYTNYQRPGATGRRLTFGDAPSFGDAPTGAVLGGAGVAVSAHSRHPEQAASLAAWLAGTETQRRIVLPNGGQPGSRAVWHDPDADALVGGFFSGTRATLESSFVRPRDPGWPALQEAAGVYLADALRRGEAPQSIHQELTRLLDDARTKELAE